MAKVLQYLRIEITILARSLTWQWWSTMSPCQQSIPQSGQSPPWAQAAGSPDLRPKQVRTSSFRHQTPRPASALYFPSPGVTIWSYVHQQFLKIFQKLLLIAHQLFGNIMTGYRIKAILGHLDIGHPASRGHMAAQKKLGWASQGERGFGCQWTFHKCSSF